MLRLPAFRVGKHACHTSRQLYLVMSLSVIAHIARMSSIVDCPDCVLTPVAVTMNDQKCSLVDGTRTSSPDTKGL